MGVNRNESDRTVSDIEPTDLTTSWCKATQRDLVGQRAENVLSTDGLEAVTLERHQSQGGCQATSH